MWPDPQCLLAAAEKRPLPKRGDRAATSLTGPSKSCSPKLCERKELPHTCSCVKPPLAGKIGKGCLSRFSLFVLLPGMQRRAQGQPFGLWQKVPGPVLLLHMWMLFLQTGGHFCQLKAKVWVLISAEGYTG